MNKVVTDLKCDLNDPLPFVHDGNGPTHTRPVNHLSTPIVVPRFTARNPPPIAKPFELPLRPIEAPPTTLGSLYTLDTQDITWLQSENARRMQSREAQITTSTLEDLITKFEDDMYSTHQMAWPPVPPGATPGTSTRSVYEYWRRKRARRQSDLHPYGYPCIEEYARQPSDDHRDLPFMSRVGIHRYRWERAIPDGPPKSDGDLLQSLLEHVQVMCTGAEKLLEREQIKQRAVTMDLYMLASARHAAALEGQSESSGALNDTTGTLTTSSMRAALALVTNKRLKPSTLKDEEK